MISEWSLWKVAYISCFQYGVHRTDLRVQQLRTRCNAVGEVVRYIIINGYYYPDILRCANNNIVAHFLRSISVYLRTPHETLARARSYKTEVSRPSLTISCSIIDKMRMKRHRLSPSLFLRLRHKNSRWINFEYEVVCLPSSFTELKKILNHLNI